MLRLAALSVPVLAGVGLPTVAQAAAPPRPTGTQYQRWEDLYRSGDTLQTVVNKVTNNRILTLPEGSFNLKDFRNGYYDGLRIGTSPSAGCRGIVGSGRNTVIRVLANTATRNRGNGYCGTQITIGNKTGAVLSNFTLRGGPQPNGWIYGGITVNNCPGAQLSWLYLRGGSRGYMQHPPGETFGINVMRSDNVTISDSEVDGRDDAGIRVAASPIGWNNSSNAKVYRTYCHHGVAGMLTFYETTNIYTEDYKAFSTSSGPGDKTGSGINHEQSQGSIHHVRPNLAINGVYCQLAGATGSTGMHISLANTRQDLTDVKIYEPTFDRGPGSTGMMSFSIRDGYHVGTAYNKIRTPPYVTKNGIVLKPSHHPTAGWGDRDPKYYYSWIH
jgi:hypothetical protein